MSKHTPGPWIRFPEIDDESGEPTGRLEPIIFGPEREQKYGDEPLLMVRETVCVLGFSHHGCHEANANLISASPDLLKALQFLLSEQCKSKGYWAPGAEMARAAIAKATGGAA